MAKDEPPEYIEWKPNKIAAFYAREEPWSVVEITLEDGTVLDTRKVPMNYRWRCFGCFAEDTHAIAGTATHSCEERSGEPFRPSPATPRVPRGR